jgi:uncharacterized protein YbjT (DUF2867 family)
MKNIILVIGATGSQGGSVAKMLLKQKKFSVRILTRNPASQMARILQRAGAEVVQGDLDDPESLVKAMEGCYGVFGMTNFWEHFAKEYQQGINVVDAAKVAGIQHLVMHSLPDYYKISNGLYSVPHYDMKAAVEQYGRRQGVPATYVQLGFYFENFFSFFPLQRDSGGEFYFGFPQGKTRLAAVSVEDLGGVVASIFDHPVEYIGRTVFAAGEDLSCAEYASIMSEVLQTPIYYQYIPRNEYAAYDFPGAEELANMFEVQRLFIPNRKADLEESRKLNPGMQSFREWVKKKRFRFLDHMQAQMDVFVI